jgi:hypothetical protein
MLLPVKIPTECSLSPDIPGRFRNAALGETLGEVNIMGLQSVGFESENEGENSGKGYKTWNSLHRKGLAAKCSDLFENIWILWRDMIKKIERQYCDIKKYTMGHGCLLVECHGPKDKQKSCLRGSNEENFEP